MATWESALGEYDSNFAAYPGVTTLEGAQDALSVVAAQMGRLRNSIAAGFERMEGLVGILNAFGGKMDKELIGLKNNVGGINQEMVILR